MKLLSSFYPQLAGRYRPKIIGKTDDARISAAKVQIRILRLPSNYLSSTTDSIRVRNRGSRRSSKSLQRARYPPTTRKRDTLSRTRYPRTHGEIRMSIFLRDSMAISISSAMALMVKRAARERMRISSTGTCKDKG